MQVGVAPASPLARTLDPRPSRCCCGSTTQADSSVLGQTSSCPPPDLSEGEHKVAQALRGLFLDDSVMLAGEPAVVEKDVSGAGYSADRSIHQQRRSALMAKAARESDSILATLSGESGRGPHQRRESGSGRKALAAATLMGGGTGLRTFQTVSDVLPVVHG